MGNPFSNPRILAVCPGICGLERGLIRAIGRIRVIAYVEIEAFIIENLLCAMEHGVLASAPIWTNVKTFDGKPFRGLVDGIMGGYPCQPFSLAGQRGGTDDPRHLYPFISGIIKAARPVWCFFENVPGHLSLGFPEVSADIRSMGYAVEAGIYSAEEAGAPHKRERLFILAIRNEYVADTAEFRDRRRYNGNTGRSEWEIEIAGSSGQQMADSEEQGLQGRWEPQSDEQSPVKRSSGEDRWPARPGEAQYPWEEARVESSLGFTVDGYNFREDLLRGAGNSVVAQTAEIAFIDLMRKHAENIRK